MNTSTSNNPLEDVDRFYKIITLEVATPHGVGLYWILT